MKNDNGFDLLAEIFFPVIPQIGGIGPKDQDIVT